MKSHRSKYIAPIIITVIMILYYIFYFGFLMLQTAGLSRILLGIVPLILTAVTAGVCIERVKEIKKGEEDDLSQY